MSQVPSALETDLDLIREVDGEASPRSEVLLWLTRVRFGLSDADSYEAVFPIPVMVGESRQLQVDGAIPLDPSTQGPCAVLVFIGDAPSDHGVAGAIGLAALAQDSPRDLEASLGKEFFSREVMQELASTSPAAQLEWIVCAASLHSLAPEQERALLDAGVDYWSPSRMEAIAAARKAPALLDGEIEVEKRPDEWMVTQSGPRRVFVAPVAALDIIEWPGVATGAIFDLNVRLGLGTSNRVRSALDEAIRVGDHSEFLASHNGLTVICADAESTADSLTFREISIVNGAQSVMALLENSDDLSGELKILVKFVELGDDDLLATKIAIRSNTQNPVTGRNLRALDTSQVRLQEVLALRGYFLDTRPDASRQSLPDTIRNDDAAQWLCGVYLERPWLAVKRVELFAGEVYKEIFPEDLDPERVILLATMRNQVDARRDDFPEALRRAWLLTALTAMYLVGQVMRGDPVSKGLLLAPPAHHGDSTSTRQRLDQIVAFVADYLSARHAEQVRLEEVDDFRSAFKRRSTLVQMGAEVQKRWIMLQRSSSR